MSGAGPPQQRRERAGDQRREPGRVAADRARDRVRRRCSRARTGATPALQRESRLGITSSAADRRSARSATAPRTRTARSRPRGTRPPAASTGTERADHHGDARGARPSVDAARRRYSADRVAPRRRARRTARHRARERGDDREPDGEPGPPALERERRSDRRQRDRTRTSAVRVNRLVAVATPNHSDAEPGVLPEAPAGERLEQRRGHRSPRSPPRAVA